MEDEREVSGGTPGTTTKAEGLPSTALGMGTTVTIFLGTGRKGCPAGDRTAGGRTRRTAEGKVITSAAVWAEAGGGVTPGREEVIGRRA